MEHAAMNATVIAVPMADAIMACPPPIYEINGPHCQDCGKAIEHQEPPPLPCGEYSTGAAP